jgi:hypothetical protein
MAVADLVDRADIAAARSTRGLDLARDTVAGVVMAAGMAIRRRGDGRPVLGSCTVWRHDFTGL